MAFQWNFISQLFLRHKLQQQAINEKLRAMHIYNVRAYFREAGDVRGMDKKRYFLVQLRQFEHGNRYKSFYFNGYHNILFNFILM